MTVTRDLFKEARRVASTKEWTKGFLMRGDNDEAIGVVRTGNHARLVGDGGRTVECDAVTACCTIGYLEYANLCDLPLDRFTVSEVLEAVEFLNGVLWTRAAFREAVKQFIEEQGYAAGDEDMADITDIHHWSAATAEDAMTECNRGDGLVAYWNDHVAKSKQEVEELLDQAAALAG